MLRLTGLTLGRRRARTATRSTTSTFTVHAGEVLGIAGVEGNGQTELVETIMGMRKPSGGTIELVRRRRQGPGS